MKKFKIIVLSRKTEYFFLLAITLNTILLCMDGLLNAQEELNLLKKCNDIITYLFLGEMILKMIALDPFRTFEIFSVFFLFLFSDYLSRKLNLFDSFIVIISLVDMIFNQINASITVVRTIRVLRVARVLRFLSYIKIIQRVIATQFSSFIYICLLLFLLIIIYSLIGVQMYIDKLPTDLGFKQSFDSFFFSFLSVFQLISIENWNDIETLVLNSQVDIWASMFYLLSLIFLGNYVFLNLFLGVLLHGFSTIKQEDNDDIWEEDKEDELDESNAKKAHENFQFIQFETENLDKRKIKKRQVNFLYDGIDCKESLWILSKKNFFRKTTYYIVHTNSFENLILFVIFLSSVKLAIDSYLDPNNDDEQYISNCIDIGFNSLFMMESFMKMVSYGLFMEKGSYLRDPWNQCDFFIVIVSLIDMAVSSINLPYMKVLRRG